MKQRKTGRKPDAPDARSLDKEAGKESVLRLMSKGVRAKAEISRRLGISFTTVSEYVDEIHAEWRKDNAEFADVVIRGQLEEIAWSKYELQEQWERSKQDAVSITEKNGKDGAETSMTTKGQCGDPSYLVEMRAQREEERLLVGAKKLLASDDDEEETKEDLSKLTREQVVERFAKRSNAIKAMKLDQEGK